MTNHHRATPEQWADQEKWARDDADSSCILELRARVEALEGLHKAVVDLNERFNLDPLVARVEMLEAHVDNHAPSTPAAPAPADSLVERLANILDPDDPICARGTARAAIREVAAWLRENPGPNSAWPAVARDLMDEAGK
jgi:hypothetical protein